MKISVGAKIEPLGAFILTRIDTPLLRGRPMASGVPQAPLCRARHHLPSSLPYLRMHVGHVSVNFLEPGAG